MLAVRPTARCCSPLVNTNNEIMAVTLGIDTKVKYHSPAMVLRFNHGVMIYKYIS